MTATTDTAPATLVQRALRALGLARPVQAKQLSTRSVYAGAQMNRLTADWVTSYLSADQSIRGDFRTLRDRARQLERDHATVSRYLGLMAENIVGANGITLKPLVTRRDGSLDARTNQAIKECWTDWSLPENASADGMMSLTDLAQLAVVRWKCDGETLIRLWRGFDNAHGFALQILDADLLDHTITVAAHAGQNEIRMGVERDGWGRPVAYHLWTRHPSDSFAGPRERVRVPASEIIHLYTVERPGQTRGVTHLAPVLTELNNALAYQEAEIVAARVGAANTFFIKQTDADGADPDSGAHLSMDIEPGVGQRLGPGEDVVQFTPQHPTGAYGQFMQTVYRAVAAGLGVSYSSLTGDLTQANYSSLRDGSLKERDAYKCDQNYIACHLYRVVYLEWLKHAALSGALVLPNRSVAGATAHAWIPRGWAWVDPQKDIQASLIAVSAGFDTRTNVCASNGRDFEENLTLLAEEAEMAAELGLTLSTGAPGAPVAAAPEPPAQDSAPDDSGMGDGMSDGMSDDEAPTAGRSRVRIA